MLIYHPAFDLNHARLRIIQIIEQLSIKEIPFDLLRILDFYFLFPHLLSDAKLPKRLLRVKRKLGREANKYNRVPMPRALIHQMRGIHETAIRSLQSNHLVEFSALDITIIERSTLPLPDDLKRIIADQPEQEKALAKILSEQIAAIPLEGPNGLKSRTGLLEYRYDPV